MTGNTKTALEKLKPLERAKPNGVQALPWPLIERPVKVTPWHCHRSAFLTSCGSEVLSPKRG